MPRARRVVPYVTVTVTVSQPYQGHLRDRLGQPRIKGLGKKGIMGRQGGT
jgi:hypothetical protein